MAASVRWFSFLPPPYASVFGAAAAATTSYCLTPLKTFERTADEACLQYLRFGLTCWMRHLHFCGWLL